MEKEEATDKLTIIAGDFYTLISTIDRKTRQKINKHTEDLNHSNDQNNLTYMYKTLLPTVGNFTFFSSDHKTLPR